MNLSNQGLTLIKEFEGLALEAYDDVGHLAIGYGHNVIGNEPFKITEHSTITESQAEILLKLDIQRFEKVVNTAIKADTDQNQYDAMISLAYNIGDNAFLKSSVLKYHNAKNYKIAADKFLLWKNVSGTFNKNIFLRRIMEANLYRHNIILSVSETQQIYQNCINTMEIT